MRTLLGKLTAWLSVTGALAAVVIATFAVPEDAFAVAGFARQTGMNCNSCHTLHGAPTPNFTFTGKKFNAAGYRLPKGLHHVLDRSQEQGGSEDKSHGEHLKILPVTMSGRFQWQAVNTSKRPGADEWGPVRTNPTSRFALFPFTGPIGDHWGMWTEIYMVPFTSEDNEWGIADTTYEEFDFRYIINPDADSDIFGFAISNQGLESIFGLSPFPGLPSETGNRAGVGGYSHPNLGQLIHYGWVNDRFIYAVGAETGDTNDNWDDSNWIGLLGYFLSNRNDNELLVDVNWRTGNDALPLVSASGAQNSSRSWQYRDSVGGISDTRRPAGAPCPGVEGRRPPNSCAYLAEELDSHTAIAAEVRWGRQNVDKIFGGSPQAGPWSFESVFRMDWNTEDYIDGAGAERNSWGLAFVLGYMHTYYFKPRIFGDFDYKFTDHNGTEYDIDTATGWSLRFAYKPTENYLLYLQYANSQSNAIFRDATTGDSLSLTADISF